MAIGDVDPWQEGFNAGLSAAGRASSATRDWTPDPHAETTGGGFEHTSLVLDPVGDVARARKALRDEFAKAAMAGCLASTPDDGEPMTEEFARDTARVCYMYADGMLAERDKAE